MLLVEVLAFASVEIIALLEIIEDSESLILPLDDTSKSDTPLDSDAPRESESYTLLALDTIFEISLSAEYMISFPRASIAALCSHISQELFFY